MWITLLLLGLAINLEPTRIALLPLLLARPQPERQILAFIVTGLSTSLGFGMLLLFVIRNSPLHESTSSGNQAQTAVGLLTLITAIIIGLRWLQTRRRKTSSSAALQSQRIIQLVEWLRSLLRRGQSPWVASGLGMMTALPSLDYLAVLAIIGSSGTPAMEQIALLLAFTLTGSLILLLPLGCLLIAPAATRSTIDATTSWLRGRSQLEYAVLLAATGVMLLALSLN